MISRHGILAVAAMAFAVATLAQTPQPTAPKQPTGHPTESGSGGPHNGSAISARNLIPDGTSLTDDNSDGPDQWYVTVLEASKSYLLEVIDIGSDASSNDLADLKVYEADGITDFNASHYYDCAQNTAAPALTSNPTSTGADDGRRCNIYIQNPANDRIVVTIKVTPGYSSPFKIRLRENNTIARWTTNGYHMFVAVQNNSSTYAFGYIFYYPNTAATATDFLTFDSFALNPYGSAQFVHNSGTLSSQRGLLRVSVWGGTDVNVQAYAFNPAANNYNFFVPEKPNNRSGNDW